MDTQSNSPMSSPKKLSPHSPQQEIIEDHSQGSTDEHHSLLILTLLPAKQRQIKKDDGSQDDGSDVDVLELQCKDIGSSTDPCMLPATLEFNKKHGTEVPRPYGNNEGSNNTKTLAMKKARINEVPMEVKEIARTDTRSNSPLPSSKKLLSCSPKCDMIEELQGGHNGERSLTLMPLSAKQWPIMGEEGGQGNGPCANALDVRLMDIDNNCETCMSMTAPNSVPKEYTCSVCFKRFQRIKAMHGHMRVHGKKRKAESPVPLHKERGLNEIEMLLVKKARAEIALRVLKERNNQEIMMHLPNLDETVSKLDPSLTNMERTSSLKVAPWKYRCDICGEEYATRQALGGHKRKHYPRTYKGKEYTASVGAGGGSISVLIGEKQPKLHIMPLCTNESIAVAATLIKSPCEALAPARTAATSSSAVRTIRLFGFDIAVCRDI